MSKKKNNIRAADATMPWLANCGLALLLIAATVIVYLPSLRGGFLFDDNLLLTESPLIKASDGLYRFWFTAQAADYWPVSNSTLWIEWRLWGTEPTGYHVTNLILHIADSLLIWLVLRRLAIPGAFLGALLFAVHPVNVDSVAWIAQRKNVLSLLFFLLSVLWYFKSEQGFWYVLSLLAFVAAMLSKGSVAIEPLLLLLVVWWLKGKIERKDLLRSLPLFVVAGVLTLVNIWFQKHGAEEVFRNVSFAQRLAGAGSVIWFYLYKSLLPIKLSFVYPQWNIRANDPIWWLGLIAALITTIILIWQRNQRWGKALLFAWLFYCICLLPVMGFTDVGYMKYSLVADHYQQIALIAVTGLIGAGLSLWAQRSKTFAHTAAIALVIAFASLTFSQSRLYGDPIRLYEDTIAKNPDSWLAYNNLGTALRESGRTAEAIPQFRKALQLEPNLALVHDNLGIALAKNGQLPEAIENLQASVRLNPKNPQAHNNLGIVLRRSGHFPEALEQYELALQLRPDFAEAYYNRALTYAQTNQPTEAIDAAEHAEQIARSGSETVLAQQIQAWLNRYRAVLAHREAIRF
jgi:protein O-mannosyl-transferase